MLTGTRGTPRPPSFKWVGPAEGQPYSVPPDSGQLHEYVAPELGRPVPFHVFDSNHEPIDPSPWIGRPGGQPVTQPLPQPFPPHGPQHPQPAGFHPQPQQPQQAQQQPAYEPAGLPGLPTGAPPAYFNGHPGAPAQQPYHPQQPQPPQPQYGPPPGQPYPQQPYYPPPYQPYPQAPPAPPVDVVFELPDGEIRKERYTAVSLGGECLFLFFDPRKASYSQSIPRRGNLRVTVPSLRLERKPVLSIGLVGDFEGVDLICLPFDGSEAEGGEHVIEV